MKNMLVLIALIGAVGCTKRTEKQAQTEELFEPKFAYMQEVTVQKGFLKGQVGTILSVGKCKEDGQGTYSTDKICYVLKIKNGTDESQVWSNVPERELEF